MFFCFVFRLSYHQRIKEMMPIQYGKLLPEIPGPTYKYAAEDAGKYNIFFSSLQNTFLGYK